MRILFSCEDFSEKSFASLINRARARRRARAREAIKPYLYSLWMVGITAKRTAIHRMRRGQESEVLALPIAGRGDVARSASPQDRRPTKQAERSGHSKPVQSMPPRFEHEHDDEHEHEDDLVAAQPRCEPLAVSSKGSLGGRVGESRIGER